MRLKHLFLVAAAVVLCLGLFKGYRVLTAKDWTMPSLCREAEPSGWSAVIADDDEPGDRLVVTGKLLESDGRTPIPGASIHMYHVDSVGRYIKDQTGQTTIRLCGIIRTDVDGNYRFETIMPGAYPNSDVPAHIHYEVWSSDFKVFKPLLEFRGVHSYYEDNSGVLAGNPADGDTWDVQRPVIRDSTGLLHICRDLKRRPWWKFWGDDG